MHAQGQSQSTTTTTTQSQVTRVEPEHVAAELRKLRDAIVWKNHRASPEVKDAVRAVAAELERTAETVRNGSRALAALRDEAVVHGHLALLEAKDRLTLLEQLVRTALDDASRSPTFIGDTARLKLALARMEASDLFEEKRRSLLEERRRLDGLTGAALGEIDERLAELTRSARRT